MPIEMNDSLRIKAGKPTEPKYFNDQNSPYADTAEVLVAIPVAERHDGLTVKILDVEYWFLSDLVTLVPKGGDNYEYWKIRSGFAQCVKFGYLYNWDCATDTRGICAINAHLPNNLDYIELRSFLGENAGGKLKEMGLIYWNNPNYGATNEVGFNAIGAGTRYFHGDFDDILSGLSLWVSDFYGNESGMVYLNNDDGIISIMGDAGISSVPKTVGCSIRLIVDNLEINNNLSIYVGNNGRRYKCVLINGVWWLAENLAETEFENGESLTKVTNATAWTNLVTEGYCAYDNNEGNVFEQAPIESLVHTHEIVEFVAGENIQIGLVDKTVTISGTSPAKYYSGLLSQVGTAAPTIFILQDDITSVILARTAAGTYTITKIGAFPAGKTIPNKQEDYTDPDGNLYQMIYTSADVMTLKTYAAVNTAVLADNVLLNQFIQIKIYA